MIEFVLIMILGQLIFMNIFLIWALVPIRVHLRIWLKDTWLRVTTIFYGLGFNENKEHKAALFDIKEKRKKKND